MDLYSSRKMTILNLNLICLKSSNVHTNTLHASFLAILAYNNKSDIQIDRNTDKTDKKGFQEIPYNLSDACAANLEDHTERNQCRNCFFSRGHELQ